jgi:Fe-S cluster assembly protein SufD
MTVEIVPGVGKWQAEHERVQSDAGTGGLRETRAAAFARFAELGFPTTDHESWRLTNVAPIAKQEWQAAGEGVADEAALAPLRLPEASVELVFVNGRLDRAHSRGAAAAGVRVESLAAALPAANGDLSSFTRIAEWEERSFVALNTALAADGALVLVGDGVRAGVIHAIFYTSAGEAARRSAPAFSSAPDALRKSPSWRPTPARDATSATW